MEKSCKTENQWAERLFRAQRWHVQFLQFYRRCKRNFWTGPV